MTGTGSSPGTPTVSVILPTFDREPLLREAVASVLAQTFGDWELIVADDGSTDGTRAYLEGLHDPRVRPLFLERRGHIGRTRAAALDAARGTWVAFLDSDDLWLPDKLALQLRRLADAPPCGWSCTGYRLIDAEGRFLPERPASIYRPISGWILEPLLTFTATAAIQTMLVRRTLLDEVGGFDESLAFRSDYDLALRLAVRSEICALAEPLTLVREHPGRTTTQRRHATLFEANARVFRKAAAAAPTAALRALCRRQCATQLAAMAAALSRERSHRAAFAALGRAVRAAPRAPGVWRASLGCMARALGMHRPVRAGQGGPAA
ncbi:MAG TPA: glycosyltransferase [Gemmatimonadaceae bacterium]|nr:glycosyltransferase [Gemmatimonadaceae bacterium]